ncbi:hypothetical protein B0T26DRAFT_493705 [Lasiosphaeria miniovina]|uniref:Uncharacterized protein n=1 Tax=Lasiosphaeria miniovina TaxID=1954250 RepID=A0AA40DJ57_9PEZI|nr:uncharacterized protein B0T26DRAFT_493705 [Lasiosphaeria miniovina]KAK0703266.1 hypothetical protein B0T26DRAFT_493705 [Lasiosphaeria miniovina]
MLKSWKYHKKTRMTGRKNSTAYLRLPKRQLLTAYPTGTLEYTRKQRRPKSWKHHKEKGRPKSWNITRKQGRPKSWKHHKETRQAEELEITRKQAAGERTVQPTSGSLNDNPSQPTQQAPSNIQGNKKGSKEKEWYNQYQSKISKSWKHYKDKSGREKEEYSQY